MTQDTHEAYRVVARRFRPRGFDEVVGQTAVLASLRSALSSGRVPHALLFSGSRGVGKTTLARILARALNCQRGVGPDPCGTCGSCQATLAGNNPDVVEIDAASHNLVDDIRELRDRVGFASMGSRFKVYILDEVHMLTRNAFNAFLKTLEEPPRNVVFILATTELHKVPETIRSRCQVHLFKRIEDDDIAARLAAICRHEGLAADPAVLRELAVESRGGMRDAETALERILPFALEQGGKLDLESYRRLVHRVGADRVAETIEALAHGDAPAALSFAAAAAAAGVDEREALGEVVEALRAVMVLQVDGAGSGLVQHTGALRDRLVAIASTAPRERIDAMIQAGLTGRERLRRLDDRSLVLEIALLRMAEAGCVPSLADLANRVQVGGAPPAAAPVVAGAAPPAVAAPRAASPAAAGTDGLKAPLLAAVAVKKPMLQPTVEACDVHGPTPDGVVELRLQSPRRMHADRLAAAETKALLNEILRELAGRPVELRIVVGAVTPEAEPPPSRRAPGAAVRRIAERFDGKLQEPD